jgi:histone H2A
VLKQIHPDMHLDGDSLLVMIDFVDLSLHRIAAKADSLLSHESQRKLSDVCLTPPYTNVQQQDKWLVVKQHEPIPWWLVDTHTKLIGHQILAKRHARGGHEEFLVAFEGYEDQTPTWEVREDVVRVGLNLGAFEAKSATDRAAAYRNFEEVYKSKTGEPFAPSVLAGRHIQAAVDDILPGEVAKHAKSELTKALIKYSGSEDGVSRARRQIGNVSCRRARACLQFPVDIVGGMLASFCGRIVCESAAIALAAVLEYLVAELEELAGNAARDHTKNSISPRHINLAIVNDQELDIWMQDSLIMGGGAGLFSYISKSALLKKCIDVKDRMGLNDRDDEIEYVTGVAFEKGQRHGQSECTVNYGNFGDRELGGHAPVVTPVATWSGEQLKKAHIVTFCAQPPPDPPPTQDPSPLHAFLCPISHDLMRDPVMTTDGMSYERCEIVEWLKTSNKSPMTGEELSTLDVKPNHMLRSAIEEWITLENEKAQKVTDESCKAGESAAITGDCMQGLVNSDSDLKEEEGDFMHVLDKSGWRRLMARAGVCAYHTLVFETLRAIAKKVLEGLVFDTLAVQMQSSTSSCVITTDLLLRALVIRGSTGPRRFGHCFLLPLGSGCLGQALMMSCCETEKMGLTRVPNGIKKIEWVKVAQAERISKEYREENSDEEDEEENVDEEDEEEEEEEEQEQEYTSRSAGPWSAGPGTAPAEEEAVVAAVVEYLVAEVEALRMMTETKEALRMIRTEKRSVNPVFALSVFSSVLCQIGRRYVWNNWKSCKNLEILWEANALVILNCNRRNTRYIVLCFITYSTITDDGVPVARVACGYNT